MPDTGRSGCAWSGPILLASDLFKTQGIRSGAFAKELFGDDEAGRPRFAELRAEGKRRAEAIERVGAELRALAGAEGLHGKASSEVAADVGAHGVR